MKKQVSNIIELVAILAAHAIMLSFMFMVLIWI